MSLLIKGMEKPQSGRKYPAVIFEKDGQWQILVETSISYDERELKRFSLVELPPHGRLKDVDKLEMHDAWIREAEGSSTHITFVYANDIANAPTVIEAEAALRKE